MEVVIALLGFFVALGALYLASDSHRKLEVFSKQVAEKHVRSLATAIADNREKIAQVERLLREMDGRIAKGASQSTELADKIAAVAGQVQGVRADLTELDHSIPRKYRVLRARPDASTVDMRN